MNLLESLPGLDPSSYLLLSRVQGTLWTLADLVICWYLIRTANLMRARSGIRRHRGSLLVLFLTVPLAILIPVAPNAQAFYRLELLVTVPHFLIIGYVLLSNYRYRTRYFEALLGRAEK